MWNCSGSAGSGGAGCRRSGDSGTSTLALSGWLVDPSASCSTGIDSLDVYLGDPSTGARLTGALLGLGRSDPASILANPDWSKPGFSINLPLNSLPPGPTVLTLVAQTHDHGTWQSSLAVVVPNLGPSPSQQVAVAAAAPAPTPVLPVLHAEVESPQPNDEVSRSFVVQVLAQGADTVEVYLEPDRDSGGRLVGSATVPAGTSAASPVKITVTAPVDGHTLYVHVVSSTSGQQQVLTVPIVVRS